MKVYIPFNMIVDTDFGIVRLVEKLNNIKHKDTSGIKSFLLKRQNENPIPEYCDLRKIEVQDNLYDDILRNHYELVLKFSQVTDILAFVINTQKLGLTNEMEITVGCNYDCDMEYIKSRVNPKYNIHTELNTNLKLNDFDYIFIKVLDEYYVNYLESHNIEGKRLYIANYGFNTIVDEKSNTTIIDPILHMQLESMGNVVNIISVYNKK